ncbi:MAG: MGDG synthase family glycosyltransferase [Deltaproteobacteria bacterium]
MTVKKVLILTTNYGDGHLKAARSIEKELLKKDPNIKVEIVNLFHEAHPYVNKFIRFLYLKCYSKAPKIYDMLYYSTKDIKTNFYINNLIGLFGKRTLKRYLREVQPEVVLNTFPVLAMPILYKKGKTKIPCYTVITDYGLHSQWIDPGVSKYFIGHNVLLNQLINQGVDVDKIEITGIPVSIESDGIARKEFIKKYDLKSEDIPVVTLLAGANSVLSSLDKIVEGIYNMEPKVQVIIACGKNKSLKERTCKFVEGKYDDRVKVFGFVDNLHEIMRGSDIVISKAGGITTTEALNMNVPLIIFGSTAGQEKENTKFLSENGCAYYAKDINQLFNTLKNVIVNKKLIQDMIDNAAKIKVDGGSQKIAECIYKKMTKKNECVEIGSESK